MNDGTFDPTPEDRDHAKEKVIARLRDADEFIVMIKGDHVEADGDPAILTCLSAPIGSFPEFAAAMNTTQMRMAHAALGALIENCDGPGADLTDTWTADVLPDPDTVEVPDFVPDFTDDAWNKPGGEFPKKDA